jgi:hypothetical protein
VESTLAPALTLLRSYNESSATARPYFRRRNEERIFRGRSRDEPGGSCRAARGAIEHHHFAWQRHDRHKVTAEGQPLAPGTYQVRLSNDEVQPVAGQTPGSERYVEFVRAGKVVAKAMATVVPDSEIKTIAKGPQPPRGGSRVDLLKGNDYVRVWINRGGNNYMIHLPAAPAA